MENKETLNQIMARPEVRQNIANGKILPRPYVRMTPAPGPRQPVPNPQPARNEQRIQELRTMPYLDYLQTPEWAAKRQQILDRDGHRCRVCNSTEQLNVHHRTYERRGDEDLDDLTTLCQPCHEYFHSREKQESQKQDPQKQSLTPRAPVKIPPFGIHTFKTFNPRVPGVQEAYEECVAYARNPDGWLLLAGPSGTGKTHLATAIANQWAEKAKVLVYSIPDMLDYLRSTPDYYKVFNQIKETDMLVLDDLGVQQGSTWVSEKLFQLLNYRYNLGMPTVIISDPKGLQSIDERIRSRLSDNSLVTPITFNRARDCRPNHPQRD